MCTLSGITSDLCSLPTAIIPFSVISDSFYTFSIADRRQLVKGQTAGTCILEKTVPGGNILLVLGRVFHDNLVLFSLSETGAYMV